MKLPVICRTCDTRDTDKLYKLATFTKRYPDKQLSDILTELTRIEVDASIVHQLPQSLCGSCARKLIGAYYYVKQALVAQELLMNHAQDGDKIGLTDCLQEVPMELCAEQHVEIKLETEDEEPENDITCTELPEFSTIQNAIDLDIGVAEDLNSKKSADPLTMLEIVKHEDDAALRSANAQKLERRSDTEDEDSLDDLPLQQRVHTWRDSDRLRALKRPTFKCKECPKSFKRAENLKQHSSRAHKLKTDWFSCSFCIRKFSHSEALQGHLRVHRDSKRCANLGENKKAKDIDMNVCKPNGYKLIECMICQTQYDKIVDLRRHLDHHPEIVSFAERSNMHPNGLAELFYPDVKDVSDDQLKELVRKDLSTGMYQRFYSITNQSGYEMDIDSTETESEVELDGDDESQQQRDKPKANYACELCKERYHRKYQLYDHQRLNHAWHEAPHVCGRCDARFVSLHLLRHHNESQCKNSQKRFLCHKCPLRFRWRHNLKLHIREHRKPNQTFECVDCKRVFDKQKSLTVHLLSVHSEESKLIPCQWCTRKFYRRDYLVKHLKRHGIREQDIPLAETLIAATSKPNGSKRITCKICNLQFDRIIDLRAHIQLELKLTLSPHQNYDSPHNYSITNDSGYELQLNDSETEDEMQMQTTASIGNRLAYVCELCKVQCKRKFEMIQHQRAMHRFDKMPHECEVCIFKCVCKSIMDQHRQSQCHSTEKKYACGKCGYKFMWPENLQQHVQMQHGYNEGALADGSEPTISADPTAAGATDGIQLLQCPHCDRTYQMKSRLNNHIRDVHINGDRKRKEAIKKFLCSLCGRETQSAATLVTHMRRHTGEKPFKCDLCEMAFPRHSEMISHRRMHTGEKPFHCTVCGKDFARSDKLKRHMLTHSGLKPHKCTYCEKSYRQAKDLKLHLQQHTGECPFICGTCGERFIQGTALEKHRIMRRHFDEVDERTTTTLTA